MGWMWACLSFSVGTLEVFLCPIWNSFSCHVKPDAKMPAEFRCILVIPFGEEKLFVFFFMFYPFLNIISSYHHQKYFDSEAWIESPTLRYEMIDNTMASDTLIGASKESITKLLGKAEWLSWDESKKTHDADKWNYGLGIEPGAFNTKQERVEITFQNGKVIALKPYQEEITFENEEE